MKNPSPTAEESLRNPRLDPKPGDVWRIAGTEGIISRVTPDTIYANSAWYNAGKWEECGVEQIGAAALWELAFSRSRFTELVKAGQLLQCAE